MENAASKKRFAPLNILYFALGLGLLFLLLQQVDFSHLLQWVLQIQLSALLLGGVLYLGKALTRAYRATRLNQTALQSLPGMLRITLASSLASQLLPLKLGELVYVYLLKKDHNASVARGISSLLILRICDTLAISLLFIAVATLAEIPAELAPYFYSILAFIGLLGLVLILMLFVSRLERPFARFAAPRLRFSILAHLWKLMDDLLAELRRYEPEYLPSLLLSCLEWFFNFAMFYVVLHGIGLPLSFFATVVCVTFSALASILPINSFGNFGTQEAGWGSAMLLLGYPVDIAITSGFATHLLTLAYMLVFGGLAWLTYAAPGIRAGRRYSGK